MTKTQRILVTCILAVGLLGTLVVVFVVGSLAYAATYTSDFAGVLAAYVDVVKVQIEGVISMAIISLGGIP